MGKYFDEPARQYITADDITKPLMIFQAARAKKFEMEMEARRLALQEKAYANGAYRPGLGGMGSRRHRIPMSPQPTLAPSDVPPQPPSPRTFVDQVDNGSASVLSEDGTATQMPVAALPRGAVEGAWLQNDQAAPPQQDIETANLRARLSAGDRGGDITLGAAPELPTTPAQVRSIPPQELHGFSEDAGQNALKARAIENMRGAGRLPSSPRTFVDSVDNGMASVLSEDGTATEMPLSALPRGAREGVWLQNDRVVPAEPDDTEALRLRLGASDPGGDFSLVSPQEASPQEPIAPPQARPSSTDVRSISPPVFHGFRQEAEPEPAPPAAGPSAGEAPPPAPVAEVKPKRSHHAANAIGDAARAKLANDAADAWLESVAPHLKTKTQRDAAEVAAARMRGGDTRARATSFLEKVMLQEGRDTAAAGAKARDNKIKETRAEAMSRDVDIKFRKQVETEAQNLFKSHGYGKAFTVSRKLEHTADNLLNGNAALDILAGADFAHEANGVGVLTNQDYTLFYQKMGGTGVRVQDWVQNVLDGRMGEEKRQLLLSAIAHRVKQAKADLGSIADDFDARFTNPDTKKMDPSASQIRNGYFRGIKSGGDAKKEKLREFVKTHGGTPALKQKYQEMTGEAY